jgi:hypothetical protein
MLAMHLPCYGQTSGFLRITAIEGDGAFNDMRRGVGQPPAVRVVDENNAPVQDAEVTFTFPMIGAGVALPGGRTTFTAQTNNDGVARSAAYKPNLEEGRFNIRVTAQYRGKTGALTLTQSNTSAGGSSVSQSKSKSKMIWVLIAGGAAGAAALLSRGSSSTPPTPATTISFGGITVGGSR